MDKNSLPNKEEINLFKVFGKFLHAMRLFVSSELKRKHGDAWERKYCESLMPNQKDSWKKSLQEGVDPIYLIDYGNLNSFAIVAKKEFFYNFFGKKSNNLPTIFNELAEVRNILAHYLPFDKDKAEKAFLHMIEIAKNLDMAELENDIRNLKRDSFIEVNTIKESSFSTTKDNLKKPKTTQRVIKRKVINLILNTTGVHIDKSNTNLSTINSTGLYSVEPNFERKENDWHLILINTRNKTISIFNIPSNHPIYDKLYKRDDKDVYRLLFNVDDPYFTERFSQVRFDQFLEKEFKYDDDSLIFN